MSLNRLLTGNNNPLNLELNNLVVKGAFEAPTVDGSVFIPFGTTVTSSGTASFTSTTSANYMRIGDVVTISGEIEWSAGTGDWEFTIEQYLPQHLGTNLNILTVTQNTSRPVGSPDFDFNFGIGSHSIVGTDRMSFQVYYTKGVANQADLAGKTFLTNYSATYFIL